MFTTNSVHKKLFSDYHHSLPHEVVQRVKRAWQAGLVIGLLAAGAGQSSSRESETGE